MAGGTIYRRLDDFKIKVAHLEKTLLKQAGDVESFEQWQKIATEEFEKIKALYEEAKEDNIKEAGILYEQALDAFLNACDFAPRFEEEKEVVNV